MSRSVKFRRPSPGDYDHQRSDSGFSDCESRTSNQEREYAVAGYEEPGLYSIRQALESARLEVDTWRTKCEEAEQNLKETRNDSEQEKAHTRALTNEISVLSEERDKLAKVNKELAEQVAQLQDTVKELKKASRKTSSPSGSSATASESSDEKEKKRRSSSKRPSKESTKDKERGREREKERENKERDKEQREKERERERERERRKEKEETERLRKRFDSRGDESDAKSSNTSTKSNTARGRRDTTSYIEPLGHGAAGASLPLDKAVPGLPRDGRAGVFHRSRLRQHPRAVFRDGATVTAPHCLRCRRVQLRRGRRRGGRHVPRAPARPLGEAREVIATIHRQTTSFTELRLTHTPTANLQHLLPDWRCLPCSPAEAPFPRALPFDKISPPLPNRAASLFFSFAPRWVGHQRSPTLAPAA